METLKIKLATLRKVDGNVRKHSEQQLKEYMRSVEAYGQLKPLVVDENGTILIGNGLYDALVGLGWTEADCYRVTGLTEKQKKKMMLSDNRIYDLGETDDAAVAELLRELEGDTDIPGLTANGSRKSITASTILSTMSLNWKRTSDSHHLSARLIIRRSTRTSTMIMMSMR